jgi:hypothetical protein
MNLGSHLPLLQLIFGSISGCFVDNGACPVRKKSFHWTKKQLHNPFAGFLTGLVAVLRIMLYNLDVPSRTNFAAAL